MRRRSTIKNQNVDDIPLLLEEDPITTGKKSMSRSSATWRNAEQGIASKRMTNDDDAQKVPKGRGTKKGLLMTTTVVLLFILPAFLFLVLQQTETNNNNDYILQQQRRKLSTDDFHYMYWQTDGMGGGTSCENGDCLWDSDRCIHFQGQCAMYLEEVDTNCGQWDECGGVVCSPDYVVDGHEVCLARRKIDTGTWAQGKIAIVKTGMIDLLHSQDFGDQMSLLPGELGGGSGCINGKCPWNDLICQDYGGQCAIPIDEIKTKCGNWDECQGMVCRKDYVLDGVNVCLARGKIDLSSVTPGMVAVAKPTVSTMDKHGDIVCSSESRFEPKWDTYYRIKTHDRNTDDDYFWTYDTNDIFDAKVLLANDESKDDPKTHWRFEEEHRGSGVWQIVNRATGNKVMVEQLDTTLAIVPSYQDRAYIDYARPHLYQKALEFRGFCANNKVRFNSAVLLGYVDDKEELMKAKQFSKYVSEHDRFWIRPSGDMDGSSRTTLQTTSYGPFEREVWNSECGDYRGCPSGFNLESQPSCGALKALAGLHSYNKCVKEPVSKNQLTKWDWVLEPVTEYKRRDREDGPVLKLNSAPEEVMGGLAESIANNGIALAGGVLAEVGAAYGVAALGPLAVVGAPLICLILDATVFAESDDEDFDKRLDDFGQQILEITDNAIIDAVSKETVRTVVAQVSEVRHLYLHQYMGEKKTDVLDAQNAHIGDMESVATELQIHGNSYRTHFKQLFPDMSPENADDVDVARTRAAWDAGKMIALELLSLYEERVALDAYISYVKQKKGRSNAKTCDVIINDNIDVQDLVDLISGRFEVAFDTLMYAGWEMAKEGFDDENKRDSATGWPYTKDYIGEMTWEILHFSYRYDDVTAALNAFKERVKKTCDAIIDIDGNDEVRERWRLFDPKNKASFENNFFV